MSDTHIHTHEFVFCTSIEKPRSSSSGFRGGIDGSRYVCVHNCFIVRDVWANGEVIEWNPNRIPTQ